MARKRGNVRRRSRREQHYYIIAPNTPLAHKTKMLVYNNGNCPGATIENPHNRGDCPDSCDNCFAVT